MREAGVLPNAGPGYSSASEPGPGRAAGEIARAAAAGELSALYLFETDPVRDHPDRRLWSDALHRAALVVAHASVLTDGLREHADVVFPAESYAEKEGTLVHPDGRVQRLRSAIGHPGEVRAGWWILTELGKRIGLDTGVLTSGMAFARLVEAVPFYSGLTLEAIGGRGVRWPERDEAAREFAGDPEFETAAVAAPGDRREDLRDGALRLGRYRPIWADIEVELSPALQYTIARQLLELSPQDARELGLSSGESVLVSQLDDSGAAQSGEPGRRAGGKPEKTQLNATAHVRTGTPAGTAFLAEGLASDSANALTGPAITVAKREAGKESDTMRRYSDQPQGRDGREG